MEIFKVKDIPIIFKKINKKNIFIDFFFHVGASHERKGERGISHLVEHLATRGENQKKTKKMMKSLDSCGIWNAETSWDFTSYYASTEKGKIKKTIKNLYCSIFHTKSSKNEFNLEKSIVIQELEESNRTINTISEIALLKNMYSIDVDVPMIGKLKDLKNITREQTIEWKNKNYRRKNMAIYISGDLSKNYLEKIISGVVNIKYKGKAPSSIFTKSYSGRKDIDFDKSKNKRITFELAYPFFKNDSKTIIKNHLLSHVMTGGGASVLHQKLRTEKGLVYWLTSNIFDFEAFKYFIISSECEKKNFNQVYDLILKGINEVNNIPKIKKTLDNAKVVTKIRSSEWYDPNDDNFFKWVILPQMKNKKFITQKETIDIINKTTPDEIYEHLKTLINNDYYLVL